MPVLARGATRSEAIPNNQSPTRLKSTIKLKTPVRICAEIVEVSSDDDFDHRRSSTPDLPAIPYIRMATSDSPFRHVTPKGRKVRYVHADEPVIVSSSDSEDDALTSGRATKSPLYSPVKVSHALIDLTVESSDEGGSDDALAAPAPAEKDENDETNVQFPERKPRPKLRASGGGKPLFPRLVDPTKSIYSASDGPHDSCDATNITEITPRTGDRNSEPKHLLLFDPALSDDEYEGRAIRHHIGVPLTLEGPSSGVEARRRAMQPSPPPSPIRKTVTGDRSPTKKARSKELTKTPRVTKKAKQAAEQTRREQYAQQLFEELNRRIFKDGLPTDTVLKWSNRLLTTAGRARWKRSRDGTQTSEIELATKILDCDERIRNTLSHEMCHLACWIIDGDPKEGHGKAFKSWAAKIMRKRSDIEVTTKHNYEINYPYEWECEHCAKVYGRYSKSIKPEECRCGACKVGKLVPLFKVRAPQTPRKTKADSRMAAIDIRGSPRNIETRTLIDLTLDPTSDAPADRHGSATRLDIQLAALTEEMGGLNILGS